MQAMVQFKFHFVYQLLKPDLLLAVPTKNGIRESSRAEELETTLLSLLDHGADVCNSLVATHLKLRLI
jgi:hypothetical protein